MCTRILSRTHMLQVPSAATVFCQPIQMRTGLVRGLNFEQANMWRWRADYEGIDLSLDRCCPMALCRVHAPLCSPHALQLMPPDQALLATLELLAHAAKIDREGLLPFMLWLVTFPEGSLFLSACANLQSGGVCCLESRAASYQLTHDCLFMRFMHVCC